MAQRSTGSRLATTTNYMHSQTAAQLCVQHCRMNVLMKWPMLADVPHQRALNNFNVKSNGKGAEFMEQTQRERRPLSIRRENG